MSVPIDSWRMAFACDGASKVFPLGELVYLAQTDLIAVLCDLDFDNSEHLVLGTDFKLTGDGSTANGALTTLADDAYLAGRQIVVFRKTDARQQADFTEGDGFPAKTFEGTIDRHSVLTMEALGRILEMAQLPPPRETQKMNDLPIAKLRANKVHGYDADGQPVMLDKADLGGGGGNLNFNSIKGIVGAYVVTADDSLCYREFDTAGEDGFIVWDAADGSIPDGMQVHFRKTSNAHALYVTPDGTVLAAVHNEQTTRRFTVQKAGDELAV